MKKIDLGQPVATKMLVYARPDENEETGFNLLLVDPSLKWWMSDEDIMIDAVVVEYVPPNNMSEHDLIRMSIATLQDKKVQIQASATQDITELDAKINKLALLTHQQAENVVTDE